MEAAPSGGSLRTRLAARTPCFRRLRAFVGVPATPSTPFEPKAESSASPTPALCKPPAWLGSLWDCSLRRLCMVPTPYIPHRTFITLTDTWLGQDRRKTGAAYIEAAFAWSVWSARFEVCNLAAFGVCGIRHKVEGRNDGRRRRRSVRNHSRAWQSRRSRNHGHSGRTTKA